MQGAVPLLLGGVPMARFPHLKGADPFPHFATVDPYARREDFDYSRYDYTAKATLCRVPWTPDYRHVVNWTDAAARDAYFASIAGEPIELQQGFVHIQTERITVPVPLDVVLTYNYVWCEVPQIANDAPIDYETTGIRNIGAFISDAIYMSPSATELVLAVDYWTTYIPHLQVSSLYLERGHAPMWAMDAATYLQDPLANSANLLTPDVNFGERSIVRHGKMLSAAQSACVYVLATTVPYESIDTIPTAVAGGATSPSWSDTADRYGHQLQVNGYVWQYGASYEGMYSPSNPTHYDGNAATGYYYYGLLGSAVASGALKTLLQALPILATTCAALYVVPQDVVVFGTIHTISGVQVHEIGTKSGFVPMGNLPLSVNDFGYPSRYRDIAKLYTMPYASIELSDDLGQVVPIAIETIAGSTLDMAQRISAAYPFLSWQAMAANVANTGGNASYVWHDVTGTVQNRVVPNTDFSRYMLDLGIPTYQLLLDAATEQASTSYVDAQQQREQAIVSYQNTMRSANTARENALDSDATAKVNADASADTSVTNTANSGRTAQSNASIANNLRTTSTARSNQMAESIRGNANTHITNGRATDMAYSRNATNVNVKSEAVAGLTNMVGTIAGSAAGGNILGGAISAAMAGASGLISITSTQELADLSQTNIWEHSEQSKAENRDNQLDSTANATDQTSYSNTANTNTTNNNVANANTNASNSAATAKANATRSRTTGDANATYSRGATEANAKAGMVVAQNAYIRRMGQASALPPVSHGAASGDAIADAWRSKGVHMRIITQSDSAISRAGDAMLRYGYQYEGLWNVDAWCPIDRDYCYWQSGDVFASAGRLDNPTAESVFERILASGTTVWNDPAKIGGV